MKISGFFIFLFCLLIPSLLNAANDKPNILIIIDNAYIMGNQAYAENLEILGDGIGDDDGICESGEDCVDQYIPLTEDLTGEGDKDGVCESGEDCIEYKGYFNPRLNYSYSANEWVPDSSGAFSGNLMNWVTMSQYDLLQYVLVGGKLRSRMTSNTLVSMSDSSWTKEYVTNIPNPGDKCIFELNSGNLTITESTNGACSLLGGSSIEFTTNKPIIQDKKETAVTSMSFMQKVKLYANKALNLLFALSPNKVNAAPPLRITTSSYFPCAERGQPYTATITSAGGTGSGLSWSIISGSPPTGISLDGTGTPPTTTLSGTTLAPVGTYTFIVQVTDDGGGSDTQEFNLEVVASGGSCSPLVYQNYNVWICAGDYSINCNNANAQVPDPVTGLYPPPCSPYDTSRCVLKFGFVDDYWDDARWGLQDFQRTDNPIIDQCIDPDPSNPTEGETPDENYLTAVENAVFIGDESNITYLVDAEYRAIEYFLANATLPGCGNKDPFLGDTITCRQNFVIILTNGEGADNPPFPNAGVPNVFADANCDIYSSNLAKNACYGNINDLRSTTLGKDDKPGTQNVRTYIINVNGVLQDSREDILIEASDAGGGINGNQYFRISNDEKSLKTALQEIVLTQDLCGEIDNDGDGYTENEGDCDDTDPEVNPDAIEVCNGIDDNCINGIDEDFNVGEICYSLPNSCGDSNTGSFVCTVDGGGTECNAVQPDERSGYGDSCVSAPNNCGDTNTGVNVCAAVGVECNAITPDDRPLVTAYIDGDDDGYGDINSPVDATCGMPSGAVDDSSDCNDNDETVNPDASEICNDGIDNNCDGEESVTPAVNPITVSVDLISIGNTITASADFYDSNLNDVHTATWNWGDETISVQVLPQGSRYVEAEHTYIGPGVYAVTLNVSEGYCGGDSAEYQYVVVYDPEGGFVTGGGWINSPAGAYTANQLLIGKATFGFVSKYKKGATVPTGETEFQFKVADLNFHSDTYQWLVIAGPQAKYKGTGTINGMGNYGFMLSAVDGSIPGGGGVDKFRIKIWDKDNNDIIVYDNNLNAAEDAEPTTELGGGSIVIHKKK